MAAKRPSRLAVTTILWRFFVLALTLVALRLVGRLPVREKARRIRVTLERLGGLWIKLGQLLSLRRDLFSDEFCLEVSAVQDRAIGFPDADVRRIIEEELGAPIEHYFEDFSTAPLAAASIGQIHRARLRGRPGSVVIKVQRPYCAEVLQRDMTVIRMLVALIIRFRILPHMRWRDMLWELDLVLREEVDYRFEAAAIARMGKSLRPHRVYVPKVHTEYCTRQVLVMEMIEGVSMADYLRIYQSDPPRLAAWMQENNVDPVTVAKRLSLSLMRQLFEDNLFHGDLHPGNIYLLRDSRIALIDFGTIGSLEGEQRKRYYMLVKAIAEQDYAKAADALFLMSHTLPEIDLEELRMELVRSMRAWEVRTLTPGLQYHEKSFASATGALVKILSDHGLYNDWAFLRIDRSQLTLDASLMSLYPDIDYPKLSRRYIRQAEKRILKRATRPAALQRGALGLAAVTAKLPETIEEFTWSVGTILRRDLQRFRGVQTAAAYFFERTYAIATWIMVLGGLFMLAAVAFQWLQNADRGWWPADAVLAELNSSRYPVKTYPISYVVLGFVLLLLGREAYRFKRKFGQPRFDIPGSRGSA